MREAFDLVVHRLIGEDITALPMAEPADIRAAQALLGRRVAIVEDGRAAIDDILARNEADPALGRAAAGYFRTFEIELDQNAVQLQAADLLLDADKVDLAAGRYRTLQAEQEHEVLQRRVRELEREKFVAMQALLVKDQQAATAAGR